MAGDQVASSYALRGTYQVGVAALDPDEDGAAGKAHLGLAFAAQRRGHRDGARAGRARLPHAALPDPRCHATWAVDTGNLDVRSVWEARVAFEQPPDALDLGRVVLNDRVRVADRDWYELDFFELLGRADLDRPELLLDQLTMNPCARHAITDANAHLVGAAAFGEPAGGDPRPVSGQLGPRPVGIPDRDLGLAAVNAKDFEHAVGLVLSRELARSVSRQPLVLDEQVDVVVR